ncbi:MAG: hypothetical protein DMG03_11990 [Acidobacteria bacterium]|nr:MAG: hypothetical protein DMG03_11990 [Acidobacteriota bacterium]
MNQLVIQLIDPVSRRLALGVDRVEPRLDVERLNEWIRIEEQLQNWLQQATEPSDDAAMCLEERVLAEVVVGPFRRWGRLAEVLEQIGADRSWIKKLLELDCSELANLLLGVVDAALLADPRADLFEAISYQLSAISYRLRLSAISVSCR